MTKSADKSPPAGSAILSVRGLKHAYGGPPVLDVEQLDIMRGETLCVMGPNGAGKSTLVRILNLVEQPRAGEVLLEGETVGTRDVGARRRMAGVFQRPHMFRGTVADNVAYGLRLRDGRGGFIHRLGSRSAGWLRPGWRGGSGAWQAGRLSTGREEAVRTALGMLGISRLADQDARRLSGGEAQRVALARALALRPDVLFLDEPASGLDPGAREDFQHDLRRIIREWEMTVIYVTHSIEEAMAAGDRLAVLCGGQLCEAGPAANVFYRPSSPLVARFLGIENLLPGRVVDVVAGGAVVELLGGARVYTRSLVGGPVMVSLHAQEITLHAPVADDEPAWTANRFPALVESIALEGRSYRVILDCGGFQLIASVTRATLRNLGVTVGAEVEARFDETAAHLIRTGRPARPPRGLAPSRSGLAGGDKETGNAGEDWSSGGEWERKFSDS